MINNIIYIAKIRVVIKHELRYYLAAFFLIIIIIIIIIMLYYNPSKIKKTLIWFMNLHITY